MAYDRTFNAGDESQMVSVLVRDATSATAAGKTGITSGLTCWYVKDGANAPVEVTLDYGGSVGTYASGGFEEIDATNAPGLYQFGIPNAAISAAGGVTIYFKGAAIFTKSIRLLVEPPVGAAKSVSGAVGSVTGAVGSVTGAVGSVTGAVGSVTGAVGSVTAKVAATVAAGDIANDAITAAAVKADAVTKIQSGLATAAGQTSILAAIAGAKDIPYFYAQDPDRFRSLMHRANGSVVRVCILGDSRTTLTWGSLPVAALCAGAARIYGGIPETPHYSFTDWSNNTNAIVGGTGSFSSGASDSSGFAASSRPPGVFDSYIYRDADTYSANALLDWSNVGTADMLRRNVTMMDVSGGVYWKGFFLTKAGSSNVRLAHIARNDALAITIVGTNETSTWEPVIDTVGTGDNQIVTYTSPLLPVVAGKPQPQVGFTSTDATGATGFILAGWKWISANQTHGLAFDSWSASGYGVSKNGATLFPSSILADHDSAEAWQWFTTFAHDAYLLVYSPNDFGNDWTAAQFAAGVAALIAEIKAARPGEKPLFYVAIGPWSSMTSGQLAELADAYDAVCTTVCDADADVAALDLCGACEALGLTTTVAGLIPSGTATQWATGQAYEAGDQVVYWAASSECFLAQCATNHTSTANNYPGSTQGMILWIPVAEWLRDGTHPGMSGSEKLAGVLLDLMLRGTTYVGRDWTRTEAAQIRGRLGLDGTSATPTATPTLGTMAKQDTAKTVIDNTYALAAGASGFAAIKGDTAAILEDTSTTIPASLPATGRAATTSTGAVIPITDGKVDANASVSLGEEDIDSIVEGLLAGGAATEATSEKILKVVQSK